jgi:3-oxoacyl-[acyl-carrier protein] reductase
MTGRRQSFIEKWAPAHGMTVEEATKKFPADAGINRYGTPEEVADLMAFLVSPAAKWLTATSGSHRRRGNQRYLKAKPQ